ncbi:MAG: ATP-binding protein [Pseudomonadota bacterium]
MSSKPKALVSWSSGKDSAWSLHQVQTTGDLEVVGLLTTVTETFNRVAMHGVRRDLLQEQALCCDLPLREVHLPWPCSNADYEQRFSDALHDAISDGVEVIVFGDLFLEDIRNYREKQLKAVGLKGHYPLWGRDTHELAREMVAGGLRARLSCVDLKKLEANFAGRVFDNAFLRELPSLTDPCGENGEFHTFVYAAPCFSRTIDCRVGERVEREGFCFADILSPDP